MEKDTVYNVQNHDKYCVQVLKNTSKYKCLRLPWKRIWSTGFKIIANIVCKSLKIQVRCNYKCLRLPWKRTGSTGFKIRQILCASP